MTRTTTIIATTQQRMQRIIDHTRNMNDANIIDIMNHAFYAHTNSHRMLNAYRRTYDALCNMRDARNMNAFDNAFNAFVASTTLFASLTQNDATRAFVHRINDALCDVYNDMCDEFNVNV